MPIYDYACGGCGEFSALRPLAQCTIRRLPAMRRVLGTHRGRRAGHLGAVVGGEPGARGERTQRQRAAQLARRPRHELRLLLGRTQVRQDPGGGGRRQIFRRLPPWMISH